MDASVLGTMPEPFALPFPEMLYVQAKIANLTVSPVLFAFCLLPLSSVFLSFFADQCVPAILS